MKVGKIIKTAVVVGIVSTGAQATTYSTYGNHTYGSDGSSSSSYGNHTYGRNSDGTNYTESTYGNHTYSYGRKD